MNEYIDVEFRTPKGKLLKIARQVTGGIVFDEPDPIERTVGIQLTPRSEATRQRMRWIAQAKGWDLGQFKLDVAVEDGNLVLRGAGGDKNALPPGLYFLRLQVEEAKTGKQATLKIEQDGHATAKIVITMDTREVEVDLTAADAGIQAVIAASTIDKLAAAKWFEEPKRPTRKACLLNLLASLRVRPSKSASLLPAVHFAFEAFNDRVFMRVDRSLWPRLKNLAADPSNKTFYAEGSPTAPIHKRLLESEHIPVDEKPRFTGGLRSYRSEGRPSLQVVIAVPPVDLPYTYAEFDLDLANPLQDVLGFIVHMGELMDGKPTNHLDLREDLDDTAAKDYLYYTIV